MPGYRCNSGGAAAQEVAEAVFADMGSPANGYRNARLGGFFMAATRNGATDRDEAYMAPQVHEQRWTREGQQSGEIRRTMQPVDEPVPY